MADRSRPDLELRVGADELLIHNRYEVASILNDIAIGVWFVVGSVLFFSESTTLIGTWFFLVGSVQLLIRPAIRLSRHIHLTRVRRARDPAVSGQDF